MQPIFVLPILFLTLAGFQSAPKEKTAPQEKSVTAAKTVTRAEAQEILTEALRLEGFDPPNQASNLEIVPNDHSELPGWYGFDVLLDGPNSFYYDGGYLVNKMSGEVWNMNRCKHYSSSALAGVQKKVRVKEGIQQKDLQATPSSAPCKP